MDGWIRIEDRKPEIGRRVLVGWCPSPFHTDGRSHIHDQLVTRELTDDSWCWCDGSDEIDDWDRDEQPTHWLPIPRLLQEPTP